MYYSLPAITDKNTPVSRSILETPSSVRVLAYSKQPVLGSFWLQHKLIQQYPTETVLEQVTCKNTTNCCTLVCNIMYCNQLRCKAVRCIAVQCSALQRIESHAVQCNARCAIYDKLQCKQVLQWTC